MDRAAEQIGDRSSRSLADDVPAGDFETGDDPDHGRIRSLGKAARIGRAPEALDLVRIVTLEIAGKDVFDEDGDARGVEGGRIDLADALDAAGRFQLDEDPVHSADMRRGRCDNVCLERSDFHGCPR